MGQSDRLSRSRENKGTYPGHMQGPASSGGSSSRGQYRFVYDQMSITCSGMSQAKRLNLIRSGLNLLHRRLFPWSMPLHMQFELTNYCNLRCPVCPTGISAVGRPPQAMSPETFKRVINQVGPYLLTASLWGWGEPNLHPQLQDILSIARQHRVVTFLSTRR